MNYKIPDGKGLYIAHGDPRQPVFVWRDESSDAELPAGCWSPPDRIAYFHFDWNNQNSDGPFISGMTGGTILAVDLFFLKLFGRIRKPTPAQMKQMEDYGFFEMARKFEQERIDAGWWKKDN